MSEKRWLIRTKSKQILGPASREKIISLLEKNSLNDDDELTSGNGYWFWVKEKDLVDKYLYKETKQEFNPISEAETKLGPYVAPDNSDSLKSPPPSIESSDVSEKVSVKPQAGEQLYPCADDLEFPEVVPIESEDLGLASLTIESTEDEDDDNNDDTMAGIAEMVIPKLEEQNDDAIEDEEDDEEALEDDTPPVIELERPSSMPKKNKSTNDRYLFVLLVLIIVILISVFYYYKTVLGKPIPIIGMSDAHAQGLDSLVKKKQLLS